MSDSDKTILVGGATGKQGGAVLKHLRKGPWKIRALTRNPTGRSAQQLAQTGVEIAEGDMDNVDSLKNAMKGVHEVCDAGCARVGRLNVGQFTSGNLQCNGPSAQSAKCSRAKTWLGNEMGNRKLHPQIRFARHHAPAGGVHGELLHPSRRGRYSKKEGLRQPA